MQQKGDDDMNSLKKKMIAGMLAGAILTAGGVELLSTQSGAAHSYAATQAMGPRGGRQMDTADMAKRIAEEFGVSESQVQTAIEDKKDFRDIGQAAMLAKLSGKSFADVMAMKTDDADWRDIGAKLGVTHDQVLAERDEMTARRISQQGNVDQDTVVALLKDGYHPQDIDMAGRLAKAADKDVRKVLSYKKINNTWSDVAKQLGVDESAVRPQTGNRGPHRMDDDGHYPGIMGGDMQDFCE